MNILTAKQLEFKKILHVLLYKFSNATVRFGLKKAIHEKLQQCLLATKVSKKMI